MIRLKNYQFKKIFITLFVFALIIIDRVMWAAVSQWHNDQAINIWLGYTRGLLEMPVGLISSQRVPNPNGMLILSYFLSLLPDLWFVSTFIGTLQAGLLIGICWSNFKEANRLFFVAALPGLVSVILRAISVEFWNQYFITQINLFFLLWSIRYLSRPTLWKIPWLVVLICLAPALYLAGIVNSLAMMLVGAGVILYRPPLHWKKELWAPVLISLAVIAVSVRITWLPYFSSVSLSQLASLNPDGHLTGLLLVWVIIEAIFGFPLYAPVQWAYITFLNNSVEIFSQPAVELIKWTVWAGVAQGTFALGAVSLGLRANWSKQNRFSALRAAINPDVAQIVFLSTIFIIISYALSPLLGGPKWAEGQRSDQVIQFLPFFLLVCFLSPFLFQSPKAFARLLSGLGYSLVLGYTIVNLAAGFFIVQSHLDYRGSLLSLQDMDVPLVQKMQAVDFIAADWKSISNSPEIPVDYQLVGGIWGWVPEFGKQMQEWYPAPMTLGRSFDYDLLRRYDLRNSQEGIQFRSFGTGRYLVSYAFDPEPNLSGITLRHYIFGRVRVSISQQTISK
jgi:hypothetical protein